MLRLVIPLQIVDDLAFLVRLGGLGPRGLGKGLVRGVRDLRWDLRHVDIVLERAERCSPVQHFDGGQAAGREGE
jgi:hypothetical protein